MGYCKAHQLDMHGFCGKFDCPCIKHNCRFFGVKTNADRIRAMSDEELANFMTDRSVNESTILRINENHGLTEVQIEAIRHNVYCALMQWLKQPAEGE